MLLDRYYLRNQSKRGIHTCCCCWAEELRWLAPVIGTSEAVPEAPTTNVVSDANRVNKRSRRVFWSLFVDPDNPDGNGDNPSDNPISLVLSSSSCSSSIFFPLSVDTTGGRTDGATGGRNHWEDGDDGEATSFSVCSSDCRTTLRGAPRWVHMLTRSLVVARISAATCIDTTPGVDGEEGDGDEDEDDDELMGVVPAESSLVPLLLFSCTVVATVVAAAAVAVASI